MYEPENRAEFVATVAPPEVPGVPATVNAPPVGADPSATKEIGVASVELPALSAPLIVRVPEGATAVEVHEKLVEV